jgi:hypothetical protein
LKIYSSANFPLWEVSLCVIAILSIYHNFQFEE